jgi:hypothetical protein
VVAKRAASGSIYWVRAHITVVKAGLFITSCDVAVPCKNRAALKKMRLAERCG